MAARVGTDVSDQDTAGLKGLRVQAAVSCLVVHDIAFDDPGRWRRRSVGAAASDVC